MRLTNIIAKFGKTSGNPILLCAHWDTRPIADRDRDPSKRKTPIIGANDGASGVAVLLELARLFKVSPPSVPVTIVLFDGEDYGPTGDDMFLGSSYFASNHEKGIKFRFGILLDMIGDKNLNIYREANSQAAARNVNDLVWSTAKQLGYARNFIDNVKFSINDDHIPLIRAGIPCVDIIDFDYMPWHTTYDTPDKCSPESLKIVGDVISKVVYSQ
ncbi:MAG: M28 family peptidase [Armatimonadota bacterium]